LRSDARKSRRLTSDPPTEADYRRSRSSYRGNQAARQAVSFRRQDRSVKHNKGRLDAVHHVAIVFFSRSRARRPRGAIWRPESSDRVAASSTDNTAKASAESVRGETPVLTECRKWAHSSRNGSRCSSGNRMGSFFYCPGPARHEIRYRAHRREACRPNRRDRQKWLSPLDPTTVSFCSLYGLSQETCTRAATPLANFI